MTPADFLEFTSEFFGQCVTIMAAKNSDYSPDDVTLGEVIETAHDLNITVQQALGVHLRKHWSALGTHLDGKRVLQSESVDNRLCDAANYLALLSFWETHKKETLMDMGRVVGTRTCECAEHTDYNPLQAMSGRPLGTVYVRCRRCLLMDYLASQHGAA